MAPGLEGATVLDVAEMLIPDKLGDLGIPTADGWVKEGRRGTRWSCGFRHLRRCRGGAVCQQGGAVRSERSLFDTGLLPGGHQAREVLRIGEEGEDEVEGKGKPLLGLKGVGH